MENNEGNAEIMGVVLLIAIFVGAITLMGVMMLSAPQPEKVPAVAFDFWTNDSHTNISLVHRGGETLNLSGSQLKIIYSDGSSSENPAVGIDGGSAKSWSEVSASSTYGIGNSINFTTDRSVDQVQLIWPGTGGASMTGGGGPVLLGAWSTNSSSGKNPPAAVTGAVPITFPYPSEGPTRAQPTQTPAVPWVYFIANITATNGTLPINFTNLTENQGPYGLLWSFGDGSTSTDQSKSVIHSFSDPDPATFSSPYFKKYTVTLTLTNSSDGTNTSYSLSRPEYITVYMKPTAQFTPVPTEGNAPFNVSFIDSSIGYIDRWTWDFGDEETGHTPGTSWHIYKTAGDYSVTLTVANPYEANSRDYQYIKVHPQVIAAFNATPMTGQAPLNVSFVSSSQGDDLTYSWEFGDGSLSNETQPIHTYTTGGNYTVNLTVSNNYKGPNTNTTSRTINVTATKLAPVASFTANQTSGTAPLNVTFTDTSTNTPTSWVWDFGDGVTNTTQNPVHTYSTFGNYTVTLTAGNTAGNSTPPATKTITVYNNQDTIRIDSWGKTNYLDKLNNTWLADQEYKTGGWGYIETAYNPIYQIGGNISNTSDETLYQTRRSNSNGSVEYRFNVPPDKTYNVQLKFAEIDSSINPSNPRIFNVMINGNPVRPNFNVYDAAGGAYTATDLYYSNVAVVNNAIDVVLSSTSGNPPIISAIGIAPNSTWVSPDFIANSTSVNAQLPIQFNDLSTGTVNRWFWDFGDGSLGSTDQNPTHTYVTPGTYKVILTAGNANQSRTVVKQDYITVYQAPVAAFSTNVSEGNSGMSVLFNASNSTGYITNYSWDFDDGTIGTGPNPTHVFTYNSSKSVYTVTLNVSNPWGSNTTTHTVIVHRPLVANFTFDPVTGNSPLIDQLNSTSTGDGTLTYLWDFGNGWENAPAKPLHTFVNPPGTDMTYQVKMKVSNEWGSDEITKPITVYQQLVPSFTASPTIGNSPLTVQFDASTSKGSNLAYTWTFGDGTSGTGLTPTHTYYNNGTTPVSYNVTLTISNTYGNAITPNTIITVYPPLQAIFNATPSEGNAPMTVNFVDNSLGEAGNVSRVWTFGDETTGSGQTPTHIYNSEGTYIVNLTIDNGFGTTSTTNRTVIVHQPLNASFTATPPAGNLPLPVQFSDTSTGYNITNWSWSFGDGVVSTDRNATHTYQSSGTFTVTLSVSNKWETKTTTRTVTVISPLRAGFSAATSGGGGLDAPRAVQFTDTSIGAPISWSWNFGDGTAVVTTQNPIHTFTSAGTYTVNLTISNQYGSTDSTSETISVIATMNHTISGIVYNDLNKNGDPTGQPGLSGWTVILNKQGSTVTTTTTGADGSYMFTGLEKNNNYVVSLGLPSGWQYTTPSTGSYSTGMHGNQDSPNTDFGVFQAPLSGNFVLNANRPGYLVAGTYLQFRFINGNPPGHIDINNNPTNLAVNDVVKIVLESDQPGIIGTNSGIYNLNLQDVTLHITRNGIPLTPSPRGAITGFSVNSFDQFQSSALGVTVPYISASTAFSVGGNTIISSYNQPYDTRNIQLTNVTPQSDGQLNLNVGSTGSYIYAGYVGSCQLLPS